MGQCGSGGGGKGPSKSPPPPPNAPSKTGNPSGPKRGNNPPSVGCNETLSDLT